ncbi:hypothetical protein C8R45DRAFT_920654 [Mycena sanguinolenta]|nr:hypothetical protein C8R45DRAFT_920654 [Mycena sanguinolenta]
MDQSIVSLLVLAIVLVWLSQEYFSPWQRRHRSFPPGPSPYPLVGNFWDISTKFPWVTYTKWGLQYGAYLDYIRFRLAAQGAKWREDRKFFEHHFRQDASRSPQEFREHLKTLAAAIIMATFYGYEVRPTNDHFVNLAEDAVKRLSDFFFSGAVAVNTFPVLRYLPSWMPGAGFQRFAAECRQLIKEMREAPVNFVKQNMGDPPTATVSHSDSSLNPP